ncbi:MAG TPA: aspartate aminotransferase family protein [Candidatus Limnocylindrales bacterium]|nr:aspartate aminotransferase family protein [Candidatus Limnocylindrales bacterium]
MVTTATGLDQAALDRGRQALLRGWSTTVAREANLLLVRAKGTRIWDVDGNEYIDCTSQAWSNNIGAGHPAVLAAAAAQAEEIAHARSNYDTIPLLVFSDRITQRAPDGLNRVGYCLHGSLAVEMALKIAAKNRPGASNPLTLYDGYHGRSLATMAASWPHTHDQFHRLMPQFVRVPQPYPYRAPAGMTSDDIAVHYADLLRDTIRRGVAGRPSALIMEPIQGNGGHVEYPRLYYKLVREICDEEGLLLIFDEIQTGLGRLGSWWASDLYGVVPDILVFGKSVAGGYPLAGVLVREDLAGFETGDDALTFGQFPVSLAAGIATLDVLEGEGLIEAARTSGEYLTSRLLEIQDRHPLMGDVRCPGLFTAVELVKDRTTKEPAPKEAERVYDLGLERGVMFGTSRYAGLGNVVKIKPPLTISRDDLDRVVDVFDQVLTEIEGSPR